MLLHYASAVILHTFFCRSLGLASLSEELHASKMSLISGLGCFQSKCKGRARHRGTQRTRWRTRPWSGRAPGTEVEICPMEYYVWMEMVYYQLYNFKIFGVRPVYYDFSTYEISIYMDVYFGSTSVSLDMNLYVTV